MSKAILAAIGLVFLTDLLDTLGQLILKSSINSLGMELNSLKKVLVFVVRLLSLPRVWGVFFLSICSLSIWLLVLTGTEIKLVFSLDSMRYILITFASLFVLKEKVTPLRWLGILCVFMGIILRGGRIVRC